jgi:hypothetical protein
MKKTLGLLAIILLFIGCNCNPRVTKSEGKRDTLIAFKIPKSYTIPPSRMGSNDEVEVTFDDVLTDLHTSYNKIEKIDKQVIDGKDTLQLHETYYCLHDSSLVIPKHYLWGGDKTKNFTANTFATKVIVINNRDTVLNKVFKRIDFDSALWDRLRRYAIIFSADYVGYNKAKHEFALGYSITIPLTDVGVSAAITVNKKGNYKILDEYAKMDDYRKD